MVENPTYSVPFTLSYQPLDTMSEEGSTPPPLLSVAPQVGASSIDMMDNECYSVPSGSQDDSHSAESEGPH